MKVRLGDVSEEPADPVPTDAFDKLARTLGALGLVSAADLKQAAANAHGSAAELGKLLVAGGLLTPFQLSAVTEGREDSLRLGNYDLLDHLGAGAMGTVFKARHRRMKRVVALKVLAASLSKNEDFVRRFQREVETVARLGHPNIVMAYDADEAEIGHFLVMEYVSGRDLAASVERDGPFSLAKAIDSIIQVARGLGYAHSQEIIHRDIKPHNLLRDEQGNVKVIDLGLARLAHGHQGAAPGADMTMTGTMMGTASYMPPEQAVDASKIDHRADIYSLGCTLYFLLTGKPPYIAPTIMSILLKHRDEEIPKLSAVRPDSPAQLDDLIIRMLAKRPENRIQQMAEVTSELESIARMLALAPAVEANSVAAKSAPPVGQRADATISSMQVPDQTIALQPNLPPGSILVVEPSRSQASIIKLYLQEQSLPAAETVTSAGEAMEAVRKLQPRVVISAMHLSDLSGVELAQQIQAEFGARAPGFILVTSESEEGQSATLSKLSRVKLLAKPFTAQQLGDAVNLLTGAMSQPQPPASARSRKRVLVVDDSSTARMHMRSVLEGLGFSQFTEVADGAHAIAVAVQETFDLVVTDYNMPLMDGRALVSYFKQNPRTAPLPIVMVTTETDPRKLDEVRQLGVVAILEKSFARGVVGPLLDKLF